MNQQGSGGHWETCLEILCDSAARPEGPTSDPLCARVWDLPARLQTANPHSSGLRGGRDHAQIGSAPPVVHSRLMAGEGKVSREF